MTARLRTGAAVAVLAILSTASGAGASARATADRITNRETVQADLNPDGSVKVARLFSQLVIDGNGEVRVVDPTSTKNIRDLDGFAKPKTANGAAIWTVDVNGRAVRRTVSDFPKGNLPVDVSVTYLLNGKVVKARDVVGKSGTLTVTYRIKNMTEEPTEVTYVDGRGTQQKAVVQVPTPYVGQLQTTVPGRFDSLDAPRADVAGDGRGGNLLTWTMVLFAPIGEVVQEFGWTAHIRNGVVPKATVQVVPVPPKRKPELKFGEDGFSNGAAQATELTAGAGEIDANVIKLRDGAATLLDGLSQLASGANDLKTGLAGEAAPGAAKLAGGLDSADAGGADLASGLGDLNDGAMQIAGGLHAADDGAQLVAGGAADLSSGLQAISAGLAQLAGVTGLPAAKAGAIALQSGVASILAGIGSAAASGTILNGLALIAGGLSGLGNATTGLPAAKGGVDAVNAGLASAKTALQGLQAAVGGSIAEISGVSATLGCPGSLNPVCPLLDSALNSSHGLSTVTLPGLAALEAGTDSAIAGLGAVSSGLATAVAGVTALSAGTAAVTAGVNAVKLGLDNPGGLGITQGLDALVAGLTAAVTGVTALDAGAADAAAGAADLAAGAGDLASGVGLLDSGATDLAAGATTAAGGAGDLLDGLDQLKAGAHDLSTGLTTAADGAGQLADGLNQAKGGGQQVTDGAGRLTKEGTSVLEKKGNDTAADAALSYARLAKLDEKAEAGGLPYGAPAGGEGSAAYLLTVNAADAQGTEDAGRAALAIGLLVVASAAGALVRRRFSAAG